MRPQSAVGLEEREDTPVRVRKVAKQRRRSRAVS